MLYLRAILAFGEEGTAVRIFTFNAYPFIQLLERVK